MSPILRYSHIPVLLKETVSTILKSTALSNVFVDCTLGGGGHAQVLLEQCPTSRLFAFDRDIDAIEHCRQKLHQFQQRLDIIHSSYVNIPKLFLERNISGPNFAGFSGIMADLGVSSHQIDTRERGFSFLQDGMLDMRFGSDAGYTETNGTTFPNLTAADLVNKLPEAQLASVFHVYGEEPFAKEIAYAIVNARKTKPFRTTLELSNCVEEAVLRARRFQARARRPGQLIPGAQSNNHPATRVFQALRIAVNKELEAVHFLMSHIPFLLAPGGIFAVITFHSLEDRLVKQCFRDLCNKSRSTLIDYASAQGGESTGRGSAKFSKKKGEVATLPLDKEGCLLPPLPLKELFDSHYVTSTISVDEEDLVCPGDQSGSTVRNFRLETSQAYAFQTVFDTEFVAPSDDEIERNRRSRSAKLRAIQRL